MIQTLAQMRDLVRQRADQQVSQFISDSELNGYINNSYAELYDLLVSRFEDYYMTVIPYTIGPTANTIPLPADTYKLRGVDLKNEADWFTVYPYNFIQRNQVGSLTRNIMGRISVTYRIIGNNINILPADRAPGDYQLWYIPRYTPLTTDSSTISNVLDFEEYIVLDAAIKCMVKEESDPTMLIMLKEKMKERVEAMASNRDAGSPQVIGDTNMNSQNGWVFPYWWW
jgi:hypothetical protein